MRRQTSSRCCKKKKRAALLTRKIFLCIQQCRTSQSPIVRLHVFLTALFSPLLRPSCVRLVVRVSFTGRRLAALFFYYYYFSHFSNEKCRRRRRRKRKTWWNAADLGLGLLVLCAAPESHARLLTFRSLLPLLLLLFFFIISFPFPLSLNPFPTAGLREDETCVYHLGLFKGMDGHFGSRREETGRSAVGFNLAITRRSNPSFSFTYYPSVGIQWRRSNKHNGRKGLVK